MTKGNQRDRVSANQSMKRATALRDPKILIKIQVFQKVNLKYILQSMDYT